MTPTLDRHLRELLADIAQPRAHANALPSTILIKARVVAELLGPAPAEPVTGRQIDYDLWLSGSL